MSKQKRILLIFAVLTTLVLAIVAVITAIRLQQIGTQPVAPSVPKSKPKAQEANQCQKQWVISEASPTPTGILTATPTPTGALTPTQTPTPTVTPTPPPGVLLCNNIDVPGGTSRGLNEQIRILCHGNPESLVTQCRFRFGDGAADVIDDDCNVLHSYGATGSYNISCEVKDEGGTFHSASACAGQIEITTGPTTTTTPIPTVPQQQLPQAGNIGQTIGVVIGGISVILLGLLMLL